MTKVYPASPLGFSPEMKSYRDKIKLRLKEIGCEVFDPWDQAYGSKLKRPKALTHRQDRVAVLAEAAKEIGRMNELGIRNSEAILAVLDGAPATSP
jgi:nucleoside 2-deoxyribosyltransferase